MKSVFLLLGCIPISAGIKPGPNEQLAIRPGNCERCGCLIWTSKKKRDTRRTQPDDSMIVCFACAAHIMENKQ